MKGVIRIATRLSFPEYPPMPLPTYTLTCTRNEAIANDVHVFMFTKPEGFVFTPGQFVLFQIPLIDSPADIQTRAFSIASAPDEPELLFVAKFVSGGRASRWIKDVLQPGDTIAMQGPFGNFLLDHATPKDYLFIATGTGIAPFRPQILSLLSGGGDHHHRIDLIFGVRTEADLFWTDDFTKLTQQHENFYLHVILNEPSAAWTGHRGRVQVLTEKLITDSSHRSVYVCGNPDMTKDIKRLCLDVWHLPKEDVHVEGYI